MESRLLKMLFYLPLEYMKVQTERINSRKIKLFEINACNI